MDLNRPAHAANLQQPTLLLQCHPNNDLYYRALAE